MYTSTTVISNVMSYVICEVMPHHMSHVIYNCHSNMSKWFSVQGQQPPRADCTPAGGRQGINKKNFEIKREKLS